jgi:hypothetical protein
MYFYAEKSPTRALKNKKGNGAAIRNFATSPPNGLVALRRLRNAKYISAFRFSIIIHHNDSYQGDLSPTQ